MTIDYDFGFISPVPVLRYNPPRALHDVFNAPRRKRYNPNYEKPGDPFGHGGLDIGPPPGVVSPWLAPAAGLVHNAAWLNDLAGFGVELACPAANPEFGVRGLHMARQLLVTRGQLVEQGQPLGTVSNTAKPLTRWVHTHLGIHWLRDGYEPNRPMVRQGVMLDPEDFGILTPAEPELELVTFDVDLPVLRRQFPPYVTDPAVQLAQNQLHLAGVLNLSPGLNFDPATMDWDGKLGPSTEEAIIGFQGAEGLVVDGIVGAVTWEALLERPTS